MNASQINSLIRTVLKIAGTALAVHGLQKEATWINSEDAAGALMTLIGMLWSHFHHDQNSPVEPINKAPLLLLAIAPLTFSGCAIFNASSTTEQKAAEVQRLCYAASSIGTQEALLQNPAWRPQFEFAYTNLDDLVKTHTITGALLRQVIYALPVKELKSDQARIAIEGATVLFDSYAGTQINIETNAYVFAAATGVRDGMKIALGK